MKLTQMVSLDTSHFDTIIHHWGRRTDVCVQNNIASKTTEDGQGGGVSQLRKH